MWTLLFIVAVVLITFRMFVWHHEDRDRMPFEATLKDEDRTRLRRLIERQLATDKNVGDQSSRTSGQG
jgi:hypothetical protein